MKYFKAALSLTITLVIVWALNRPWGSIPAFGPLLSPFVGFWQNAEPAASPDETLDINGTRAPITVLFDDLGIPHVFAQNDYDAYFAQGYLTARDRLWQMEFQTHAAAGRLSEIVGERALDFDRYNRRLGLGYGAEKAVQTMMVNPTSRQIVEAYTAGINAWISQLTPADYPIEYKLLGYAPEPWAPIKCAYLLKQMTSTLASGADDLEMTNILRKFGPAITADLFPSYPTREDPIIPPGTKWDFAALPLPKPPADSGRLLDQTASRFDVHIPRPNREIGSNNWAVGAQKSATGYPILANDPHLGLSLPSIWYQIQLVTPTMNVYGASLPGAPGVVIGFNKDVAWGVTNVGADILDFYTVRFKDASRQAYWHDGQWKPVRQRIEVIKVKGKPVVQDTVLYTHHGPVVYSPNTQPFRGNIPVGHAARWVAHEPANDLMCFYHLNRAKTYDDYTKALAQYAAPAQNFVFASNQKDIAISPNGYFPLKYKNQGKFILDGTNPADDWHGRIPPDQNPRVKNPPRGFVSSANQSSTDPSYPYYINWEFAPSERGRRINQRLSAMQRATVDSLRQLQNDNYNLKAADALPICLPLLKADALNSNHQKALAVLKTWRLNNDTTEIGPTIFNEWMNRLMQTVWNDEFGGNDSVPLRMPSFDRTLTLMQRDPNARWFDNVRTPARESLIDVVTQSFSAACDTLAKQHGAIGRSWAWGPHKGTDIRHLLPGLDAFSVLNLNVGGGSGIVNATSERWGPSWRMVVALGPQPKAYGLYPGGQSGNPGSPLYQNMIEKWAKGELYELLYLQSPTDAHKRLVKKLTLN
ncbi:penicillin acylase family protein [Fibrisoma montanum]|uniref:Penicillin acylase family protein n=1 Tax=Fibrisoma montanum TaxID=2305895 RepID=A0A418MJP4_9BACT|nr:penicillin acylase family protein [Fibrisoma montanum]RIV27629.1 penicillin acylase family protein [Fibrisoma montanum]